MDMKKGLASLPLYRLYLEDFRVFGDMPVKAFVVGEAQDAFAEFVMQEDNDLPAFMQQQIDDIRWIQERYAWFLDGIFAGKPFEKKKGQRKLLWPSRLRKKAWSHSSAASALAQIRRWTRRR